MGLKEIDKMGRVVFLSMFAEEMFRVYVKKFESKKNVEVEKVKSKILEPIPENVSVLNKLDFEEGSDEGGSDEEVSDGEIVKKIESVKFAYQKEGEMKKKRKVPVHFTKSLMSPVSVRKVAFGRRGKKVKPVNVQSGMVGINNLLRDGSIQSIECSGPGKNLVVKRNNKINVTKLVFGPIQIKEVIDYFSGQARIPVANGILKAAVGDLIISSVSSNFVGSRFIITRNTPYSLIDSPKNRLMGA